MFRIRGVIISAEREMHVWTKHQVTPEEVEEVCLGNPLPIRGRDGSYAVYGQTEPGRYLAVFLFPQGAGIFRLATAREMNQAQRRRYQRSKGR